MKRKPLLFLMLMAFGVPLAMNGQTQNLLLSQNFDGNGFTISDDTYDARAWYTYNAGSGNNWELYQAGSTYTHSGDYCMLYAYNSDNAANCYLVSEPFSVNAKMTELSVSLYEAVASSNWAETFEVFFVKANDVTDLTAVASATHYGAIASASYTNENYSRVSGSVTSSALKGQSVRVVVHCTSIADRYRLYIDDITVTETLEEACPKPTGLTASNVTNNSAVISWDSNADSYNLRYGICAADPNQPATIILTVGDVWEDGSGYQMLLDADATAYGTIIPETDSDYGYISTNGTIGGSTGNVLSSVYDEFEYKIPETADGALSTGNIVINNTITIQIPAGTYDWCITNPTPGARMWIASSNGNIGGRADDYVFEGGKTYTFNLYLSGENDATDVTITCNNLEWTYVNNVTSPYTLEGLTPETDYVLDVQANCGSEDGTSAWVGATFTTLDDCALPYELSVTNLTAASSTLNWTGAQEAYNVRYRSYTLGEPQEYVFEEGFEGGSMPTGWTTTGSYWKITSGTGNSGYTGSATGNYNAGCYISSYSGSDILITPAIDLSQATSATLTFNFWNTSWSGDINTLNVYYRVDGGNWSSALYTNNSQVTPWTSISVTLPSSGFAANYQIGFECVANYSYGMGIDDVKIAYTAPSFISYGEWLTKTSVTSPLTIDDLTPTIEDVIHYLPSNYEWQVQGVNCDGNGSTTIWSAPAIFTTPEGYIKPITGYGTGTGNWYLIASPIGDVAPTNVTNMISNSYDLYYFDQDTDGYGNEWINYKGDANTNTEIGSFGLEIGKGYLYANSEDVPLFFIGRCSVTESTYPIQLKKTNGKRFEGWNLVGNPFAQTAYVDNTHNAYYTMNNTASAFIPATNNSIEAMEGIFVKANSNEETITFSTTAPNDAKCSTLELNLTQGQGLLDRAIVRFDEGCQLPKLQFNRNNSKVYIPLDSEDYAVVRAEEMGEMPVNFKAESNGTYSLNFSNDNVEFAYLHLIDNLTGNDVNLLQTPSYSFEAKTTNYESRFKLVFATGNNSNDDNFAFFSNGSFVINNEGEATLQVIDVTGRVLKSETINGCANVNVDGAAGVYMLRLINGDDMKVQKVVVK